jgi:hypothetical protein
MEVVGQGTRQGGGCKLKGSRVTVGKFSTDCALIGVGVWRLSSFDQFIELEEDTWAYGRKRGDGEDGKRAGKSRILWIMRINEFFSRLR